MLTTKLYEAFVKLEITKSYCVVSKLGSHESTKTLSGTADIDNMKLTLAMSPFKTF